MTSTGVKTNLRSVETIRREWALRIEQDIRAKRSRIVRQVEEPRYEDRITLTSLLQRRFYALWWQEFFARYPGVTVLILLLSMTIGVLLAFR
jgi:hypothetical protein